jgi:general secretion pathway protein D
VPNPPRLLPIPLLAALAALAAEPLLAQEAPAGSNSDGAPRDDAALVVEYRRGEGIPVQHLLQAWATKFGALPLVDESLRGTQIKFLTHADAPLTWGTVKEILRFHGIVVTEVRASNGGHWLLRANPRARLREALDGGPYLDAKDLPDTEELLTAVFPIQHGAGQTIFSTVRTLQSQHANRIGSSLFVAGPDVLIVVDLTSQVRYLERVVRALDVPGPTRRLEIYQVEHARAEDLAQLLLELLRGARRGPRPGAPVAAAGAAGDAPQILADPRTNQLAVAAMPIHLPRIERLLRAFDVPVSTRRGRTRPYRCRHGLAVDLASRLNELFGGGAAPAQGGPAQPRPAGPRPGAPTRIVADQPSNTLLIQAEDPVVYAEILAVLAELDRRPAQVHLEVLVYEVSTPVDQISVAVELMSLTQAHDGSIRPAAATGFGISQVQLEEGPDGTPTRVGRVPNVSAGLTALISKDAFDRLPILLSALSTYERTEIVDRSFASTDDNKEATFRIVNSQPYVVQVVNEGVTVPDVRQAEAVTAITVKPRVNAKDSVTLQFSLSLSSFAGSGSPNLPPATNAREYTGEAITVPDGAYVVFGGLESETYREVESKVPFLGDLPILGHLFKNWTRTRSKGRLYIFVRPTIVEAEADPDFVTQRKLADKLLEAVHLETGRAPWLPLVDREVRGGLGYDLSDLAFDVFGTGSGNPFR